MANYQLLKADIDAKVYENTHQEITGANLNAVLNAMVTTLGAEYQFAGVATIDTNPGTPDAKVFYIANGKGTYTNFGGLEVTEDEVVVLYWDTAWHKVSTGIASQAKLSELDMTKYMMTLDTSGNNIFDSNYIRHGKIVRTSSPYDIFDFAGAGVSGFYRVPSTCKEIRISGIVASGDLFARLSKTPQDDSDSVPYQLNIDGGTRIIPIDDTNKNYPYLCVGAYRVSGTDTPDLSNVNIAFVGANEADVVKQFQNNVWKSYGDEVKEDDYINSVAYPGLTRRMIYDSFRSVKFFGCDKSIPRTIFVVWKKNSETKKGNLRISRYNFENNSWSTEFVYSGVLSNGINQNGIAFIKIDSDISGDTSKSVELLIDLSQMPLLTDANYVLNPLTSTPERVFSDTCYYEDVGVLSTDVAGLKTKVPNIELNVNKLEKGFVYGADLFTINGFINSTNGAVAPHQTLKCTDFIPVLPGQVYTTLVGLVGTACNGFYDENKVFVGYWNAVSEAVGTMTIPANAYYMRLSSRNVASPYAALNNPPYKGVIELTEEIEKVSGGHFKHKTKRNTSLPIIAFTFDDCHTNDALIVDLFDQYGLTCGFAFIASEANITTKGEIYRGYQDKGYDILNHSVDGKIFNTTNYTLETATAAIATAMERMEKVGIVANGFVAPSSSMEDSFIPMLRKFHSFACLYGGNTPNASNADVCKLTRYSLHGNSLATIKASIDSAIANNACIIFYSHSADFGTTYSSADNEEWNIAKLKSVLDYCIEKRNNGDCFLGSIEDCMKSFYNIY